MNYEQWMLIDDDKLYDSVYYTVGIWLQFH